MYSFARTLIKNNEILRENTRRKYEVWDLNSKLRYDKDSLKNAKKGDKGKLNFILSEDFNDEFENSKLRRLLLSFAVLVLLVGLFLLS